MATDFSQHLMMQEKWSFLIFRFISFKIVASLWQVRSNGVETYENATRRTASNPTRGCHFRFEGCGGYAKTTALNIYVAFQLCINWMTERASALTNAKYGRNRVEGEHEREASDDGSGSKRMPRMTPSKCNLP